MLRSSVVEWCTQNSLGRWWTLLLCIRRHVYRHLATKQ